MTKTFSAVVAFSFLAAACGPADLAELGDDGEATVAEAPGDETASSEQALCSGWGPWARYKDLGNCTCGSAKAWASTAAATDSGVSGWTAGVSHTGRSRRVQAKCSRRIDGRTTTVTSAWSAKSSNIFAKCPPSYPDVVEARCSVR